MACPMDEPFADRWARKWAACGFEDIGTEMVACGDAILPDSAAPYLTFDRAAKPSPVWAVFGIPSRWPPADRERLAPYRVIGADGAGNPVCVEEGTGAVVLLDHEDRFHTRQFINSSVRQLAECLLAYMGERDTERFRSAVRAIDAAGLTEHAFWWGQAPAPRPGA